MDLKRNIEEFDLAFLDLETTGLDVFAGDAICEIGALKVRQGKIVDKFQSLINPRKNIPYQAYLIHKISDKDVEGAPTFCEVVDQLLMFLDCCVICAYNAEFDITFLNQELKRINRPPLEHPTIDILSIARKNLHLARYNLGASASFFNLENKGSHRALEDASLAFGVFLKLREILKSKGIASLENYISFYGL